MLRWADVSFRADCDGYASQHHIALRLENQVTCDTLYEKSDLR